MCFGGKEPLASLVGLEGKTLPVLSPNYTSARGVKGGEAYTRPSNPTPGGQQWLAPWQLLLVD